MDRLSLVVSSSQRRLLAILGILEAPVTVQQLSHWTLRIRWTEALPDLADWLVPDPERLQVRPDVRDAVGADARRAHRVLGAALLRFLTRQSWPQTAHYELLHVVHHLEAGGLSPLAARVRGAHEYVNACFNAGNKAYAHNDLGAALPLLSHARRLQEPLAQDLDGRLRLMRILNSEGAVLTALKRDDEAAQAFGRGIELGRTLPPQHANPTLASCLRNLGLIAWTQKQHGRAVALYHEAYTRRLEAWQRDVRQWQGLVDILLPFYRLLSEAGRTRDAAVLADRARRQMPWLLTSGRAGADEVLRRLYEFGRILEGKRDFRRALAFYHQAQRVPAPQPSPLLGELYLRLGLTLDRLRRPHAAIRCLRASRRVYRKLPQAREQIQYADSLYAEARCWMLLERPAAALRCVRRVIPLYVRLLEGGRNSSLIFNLRWMVDVLGTVAGLAPVQDVIRLLDTVLELYGRLESRGRTSFQHGIDSTLREKLGVLVRFERREEAWNTFHTWMRVARLRLRSNQPGSHLDMAQNLFLGIWEAIEQERGAEARALLWEAWQHLRDHVLLRAPDRSLPPLAMNEFGSLAHIHPWLAQGDRLCRLLAREDGDVESAVQVLSQAPRALPPRPAPPALPIRDVLRSERPDARAEWVDAAAARLEALQRCTVVSLGTRHDRSRLRIVPRVVVEAGATVGDGVEALTAIAADVAAFHRRQYGPAAEVEAAPVQVAGGASHPYPWYETMLEQRQFAALPYQRRLRTRPDQPYELALLMVVSGERTDNSQGHGGQGYAVFRYSRNPDVAFVAAHELYHSVLNLPHAPDPTSPLVVGDNIMTSGASSPLVETPMSAWHRALTLTWRHAQACIEQARGAQRRGRDAEALALYLEALRLDPLHLGAHHAAAQLQLRLGRIDAALELMRGAAALDVTPVATIRLGQTLMAMGRAEEARGVWRGMRGYGTSAVRFEIGGACMVADHEWEGLRHSQHAASRKPAPMLLAGVALAWHNLNRYQTAARWYRRVLARRPSWGGLRMRYAVLLADLGQEAEARAQVRDASRWQAASHYDHQRLRARVEQRLGRWDVAARLMENLVSKYRESGEGWLRLGYLQAGLGRPEEARRSLEKARYYHVPRSTDALLAQGWLLWLDDPKSLAAANLARQILRRAPLSPMAWGLLAVTSGEGGAVERYRTLEPQAPFLAHPGTDGAKATVR